MSYSSVQAARAAAPEVSSPSVRTHRNLRPTRIAAAVQLVVLGGLLAAWQPVVLAQTATPAAEQARSAQERNTYDIPAGPLAEALARFARESGALLAATPEQVQGKTSPGLRGNYTVQGGFSALLAGTGLEAFRQGEGSYGLRAARAGDKRVKAAPTVQGGQEATLQAVTVLGARDPSVPLSNVPASISILAKDRIATEQATAGRIEDLLGRTIPGFNPTNNGVRQIRGRTAQVFINGVPNNEQLRASSGSDLNLLAPDQLDMIEVARGANSAYGFGAPGGIIALSTPRAESENLTLKTKLGTSFNTSKPGGSFQTSVYQSASRILGDFDYHVGLGLRQDGLSRDRDGSPAVDYASPGFFSSGKESLYNFDTSLGYRVGQTGNLRLAVTAGRMDVDEHYENDYSGTYRSVQSVVARTPVGDRNSRRDHTLNLSYENSDVGGSALKLEAVASKVRTLMYSDAGTTVHRDEQTNEYRGLRSAVTTPLDAWHQGASMSYGLDLMRNTFYRPLIDETTGQVFRFFSPDVTLDSVAPYVQVQSPFGNLRLNAGVRHEKYSGKVETAVSTSGRGDIQGGDIKKFDLTLFNAGAVYSLDTGRELYASFTQGAEISQLGRAATTAVTAARIDPQPAKSDQYELGLRHRSKLVDYTLAAFYTESDLISALDCSSPTEPCQPLREPRKFWGVEGTLGWRINDQWGLGGTLSWMDGVRKLDTGETRRISSTEVPPLSVSAYIDYRPTARWNNRLQLDFRGSSGQIGDSPEYGEGRVDDELLVHIATGLSIGKGDLQIGIRNLFDKKYFALPVEASNADWAWVPEQGRRVSVSYSIDW